MYLKQDILYHLKSGWYRSSGLSRGLMSWSQGLIQIQCSHFLQTKFTKYTAFYLHIFRFPFTCWMTVSPKHLSVTFKCAKKENVRVFKGISAAAYSTLCLTPTTWRKRKSSLTTTFLKLDIKPCAAGREKRGQLIWTNWIEIGTGEMGIQLGLKKRATKARVQRRSCSQGESTSSSAQSGSLPQVWQACKPLRRN